MPKWNAYTERQLSRITARLKRKRVEMFVRILGLRPDDIVLDLGSEDGSYLASYYPYPRNIVLADLLEEPMKRGVARHGLKSYVVLEQDEPIPAGDREFDAVWCNSVIEHVTIDRAELASVSSGAFRHRADQRQRLFAQEISRVGKRYFVQTPYLHFPLEAHAWLPGVQYLPQSMHWRLSRWLKKVWVKQWGPDYHLYDFRRFRAHFPDATFFHIERFLGLPKSLLAIRTMQRT